MSFIRTTPIIGNRITLTTWPLYFFDLLMLWGVFTAVSSVRDLSLFSERLPQISVFWGDVTNFGWLGVYSFRIASYVAIFRRCRKPQVLEWWIVLVGFGATAIFCIFGGPMLKGYASVQGYKYCREDGFRGANDLFVPNTLTCPPAPDPHALDK